MNAKYLIAALVAIAPVFSYAAAPSGLTRAEVIAEIAQARADGSLPLSEASFLPYQFAAAAPATREQVTAELYRTAGGQPTAPAGRAVHVCQNEAECDAAPHRDFTVTRAQVLAELYRARAAGEIAETEADNDVGRAALRAHGK
jgi:hypothetical protein